jgi:hypothetical protein
MATGAAAVLAKARRDVISHFMQCNAVSPAAAVRWVPERRIQRRMLERLARRGVLVETAAETYYLDVPTYDRWKRSVRKRVGLLLAGVVAIGAAAAALV